MENPRSNIQWFDTWARRTASMCTFNFFIGGRGIGKTFSYLKGHRNAFHAGQAGKLVYLRLTGAELEGVTRKEENPYKRINELCGFNIELKPDGKKSASIVEYMDDGTELVLGSARSLASFHNLRGVDFSDYTDIYFDEFLPTEHVRRTPEIKRAGYLFEQAYETINRNREFETIDGAPVIVVFTANAFSLDSDILTKFKVQKAVEYMQSHDQARYTDRERGVYVERCEAKEIANMKRKTALYKAIGGDKKTEDINLSNAFVDYALSMIVKKPQYNEYKPLVTVAELTIYAHKSNGFLHVAKKQDTSPLVYGLNELAKFYNSWYGTLAAHVADRLVTFDSAESYYLLLDYLEHGKHTWR